VNINCPDRGDLQLRGSGIVLVPSLFVGPIPVLLLDLADPSAAPTLIFPAAQDPDICRQLWNGIQPRDSALAALVGRTRAAALRKIVGGCTTSELARGLGISASSASEHAAVLRDAGLVSTSRHGGAALHTLTSLGKELLRDAP
jgi:DNA-binding transcriptional ArsR family regulator